MNQLLDKLNAWNKRMNGLPRIAWLVAATLFCTWLFFIVLPYCWPFVLAFLLSRLLIPPVRFCMGHMKRVKLPRGLITLIGMILLFGILGTGVFALINRMIRELVQLLQNTPAFVTWLSDTALPYIRELYQSYSNVLPESVMVYVDNAISSISDSAISFAGTLSASITGAAVNTAASVPTILLSIVLTIMGTYYMTADKNRIEAFYRRTFPEHMRRQGTVLKNNLIHSLFGQIKSQLLVSLIITVFLMLIFVVFRVRYGLLLGFIIGAADALPVIGAGLFLIPWCLFELVMGNFAKAAFFAIAYICVIIIRQIAEPRIVGHNLGLYPLATMIAMYAGFCYMGFLGLIAGPILLSLLRVVLQADAAARRKQEAETNGVTETDEA